MVRFVVFGGTSEGRAICELLQRRGAITLACVATEYGEALLQSGDGLTVRAGRLDEGEMRALLESERPELVIDATHPYAYAVSANVAAACTAAGVPALRVLRESSDDGGCERFADLPTLVDWLNGTEGNIFVATGAKDAAAFTKVQDFERRVHLRLLPSLEGLQSCLKLGYPAAHLICMQGPFSRALNAAMLRETYARILVTKQSGAAGGFEEKLLAAQDCGVKVAVLRRRGEEQGVPLHEAMRRIEELL